MSSVDQAEKTGKAIVQENITSLFRKADSALQKRLGDLCQEIEKSKISYVYVGGNPYFLVKFKFHRYHWIEYNSLYCAFFVDGKQYPSIEEALVYAKKSWWEFWV